MEWRKILNAIFTTVENSEVKTKIKDLFQNIGFIATGSVKILVHLVILFLGFEF
jgi:hypothetical protein